MLLSSPLVHGHFEWCNTDEAVLSGYHSTCEELLLFYYGIGLFGWVNHVGEGLARRPIRVGALWRSETVVNLVVQKTLAIMEAQR